jgi:hypothetical protein
MISNIVLSQYVVAITKSTTVASFVYSNHESLDFLLYASFVISFLTYFVYLKFGKTIKYAFGKTLFSYSLLMAFLVFFNVEIANGLDYILFHIALAKSGFPWWTESVTSTTAFWKMSDFVASGSGNVYFLNYAELFVISVVTALIGYRLYISETEKVNGKTV